MASRTTTQSQSWTDNSYVVALFQVLMGFGLVWLVRSACQLMRYMRKGVSTENEAGLEPNIGGSDDAELGELNGQGVNDVDSSSGPETIQSVSHPQRAHHGQEQGHQEFEHNTTNLRGVAGSEAGELNEQEVDDIDSDVGHEATDDVDFPSHVILPQEYGHGQRAAHEDLAPTLGGQHV